MKRMIESTAPRIEKPEKHRLRISIGCRLFRANLLSPSIIDGLPTFEAIRGLARFSKNSVDAQRTASGTKEERWCGAVP